MKLWLKSASSIWAIILLFFVVIFSGVPALAQIISGSNLQKTGECLPDLDDPQYQMDYEALIDTSIVRVIITRLAHLDIAKNYQLEETVCDFRIFQQKRKSSVLEIVIVKQDPNNKKGNKRDLLARSTTKYPKLTGWLIEFQTKAEKYLAE